MGNILVVILNRLVVQEEMSIVDFSEKFQLLAVATILFDGAEPFGQFRRG